MGRSRFFASKETRSTRKSGQGPTGPKTFGDLCSPFPSVGSAFLDGLDQFQPEGLAGKISILRVSFPLHITVRWLWVFEPAFAEGCLSEFSLSASCEIRTEAQTLHPSPSQYPRAHSSNVLLCTRVCRESVQCHL